PAGDLAVRGDDVPLVVAVLEPLLVLAEVAQVVTASAVEAVGRTELAQLCQRRRRRRRRGGRGATGEGAQLGAAGGVAADRAAGQGAVGGGGQALAIEVEVERRAGGVELQGTAGNRGRVAGEPGPGASDLAPDLCVDAVVAVDQAGPVHVGGVLVA